MELLNLNKQTGDIFTANELNKIGAVIDEHTNVIQTNEGVVQTEIQSIKDQKADKTEIPTKLSQLNNDNNTVTDQSYVHTDQNFTLEEKTKLQTLQNYVISKEEVEGVLVGDITSHNHASQLAEALINYVQKVSGKDLSSNDFTNELKLKLDGLSNYDDKAVLASIQAVNDRIDTLVGTSATEAIDTFNEIETFLQGITDTQTLTGLLNDLKQEIVGVIPTKISDLTNDSDFVKESQIADMETKTDAAKAFQPIGNYLTEHQKIKTINNQSLLGEGNIVISSGSDQPIVIVKEVVVNEGIVPDSEDAMIWVDTAGSGFVCEDYVG